MSDTSISFYLRANRIHIFVEALRSIGSPSRICFMISEDGEKLLITAYRKKDLRSHKVPGSVYMGRSSFEVSSWRLCSLLTSTQGWIKDHSYRIPGTVYTKQRVVVFQLSRAKDINSPELVSNSFT